MSVFSCCGSLLLAVLWSSLTMQGANDELANRTFSTFLTSALEYKIYIDCIDERVCAMNSCMYHIVLIFI